MKIIDAHMHAWNLEENEYDWLKGNKTILGQNHEIPEIEPQLQESGISAAILIQAANTYEDTQYMLKNAALYPWIKGVVGWLPLNRPEEMAARLEEYIDDPYISGIRHLIHDESDNHWLLRDKVRESLKLLADNGVPFDVVGILPEHLRCVLELGEEFPHLKMVLDHLSHPPVASGKMGKWGELMAEVAENPNVFVKISGLGTLTNKPGVWDSEDIRQFVDYVLEEFGVERCMCGGDWPVSLLGGSYQYTWSNYKKLLGSLLDEDSLKKVYQTSAENFYNIKV